MGTVTDDYHSQAIFHLFVILSRTSKRLTLGEGVTIMPLARAHATHCTAAALGWIL